MQIQKNTIAVLSEVEKREILDNAYVSFQHGVEHFAKYKEGERNIKFAILHIFNTVELLVKGYLGSVNLNLLKPDIDKSKNIEKTADISVLLERMNDFSEVQFDAQLYNDIQSLRKKRNDIEHKKFVSESDEDLLILYRIIAGLIIFSYKHLQLDITTDLITNTKHLFDGVRAGIDKNFAEAMEKAATLQKRGFVIGICSSCLNKTVPYRKPSKTYCLYCKKETTVHMCETEGCGNIFIFKSGYPGHCDQCHEKEENKYFKNQNSINEELKNYPAESWENLPREDFE